MCSGWTAARQSPIAGSGPPAPAPRRTERSDLMPSVERIMNASLEADERLGAMILFRDSLHTPGDVNRDPRVAIERSRTTAVAADATRP